VIKITRKELSQVYWLKSEIKIQLCRLEELEILAESCSVKLTNMPKTPGISDKVAKYASEIADLKNLIDINIKKCFFEFNKINKFICTIDDSFTRQIFSLRYISGMSWRRIARLIGGFNTEDSVRKMHDRFLAKF
jgi:hypothetical protein